MPRFFFHITNKDILLEDCEGADLPDLQAALGRVLHTFGELASDPLEVCGLEFVITDSSGRTLLKVPVPEGCRQRSEPLLSGEPGKEGSLSPKAAREHLH
jgi:hypothetical protein